MAFSSIIISLLHKACGKWIKDFKKSDLVVSALAGTISISNFELNMEELQRMQLGIQIERIAISHLQLWIPYTQLTTKPLEFEINDVQVFLCTPKDTNWDRYALYVAEQTKIALFEKLLNAFRPSDVYEEEENGFNAKKAKPPSAMMTSIIRNFSMDVNRLHIRLEDASYGMHGPLPCEYSIGLVVEHIRVDPAKTCTVVQKCGENGIESYRKDIAIHGFGIYFHPDKMFFHKNLIDAKVLFEHVQQGKFLLKPTKIGIVVQLSVSKDSFPLPQTLDISGEIQKFDIKLNMQHCRCLLHLLDGMEKYERYTLYRRFKPKIFTPKAYWKYAITCTLMDIANPENGVYSWKKTINLMLVGLQYIAIRKIVRPHLCHEEYTTPSGEVLEHIRESFKGVADVPNFQAHALDGDNSMDPMPKHQHSFKNGILAEVYGLIGGVTTNDSSVEGIARKFWLRQLSIDASFRPIVIARLRILADQHAKMLQRRQNCIRAEHIAFPGVLTITLSHIQGTQLTSNLSTFAMLKIGHKGKAYKGARATELFAKEKKKYMPGECTKLLAYQFCQTVEFHVHGSEAESMLYLDFYDEWPLFNKHLGKAKLDLVDLIRSDPKEYGKICVLPIVSSDGTQIADAHISALFVATESHDRSSFTSRDILDKERPWWRNSAIEQFQSWYGDDAGIVKTSRLHKSLAIVHFRIIFSLEDPPCEEDISVSMDNVLLKRHAYFDSKTLKWSKTVESIHVTGCYQGKQYTMLRSLVNKPFSNKEAVKPLKRGRQMSKTVQAKSEMEVSLYIPLLDHYIAKCIRKAPNYREIFRIFSRPLYRGAILRAIGSSRTHGFQFLMNHKLYSMSTSEEVCINVFPRCDEDAVATFYLAPSSTTIDMSERGLFVFQNEKPLFSVPMSPALCLHKLRTCYDKLQNKSRKEKLSNKNTQYEELLRIQGKVDDMKQAMVTYRRQLRSMDLTSNLENERLAASIARDINL